MKASFVDRNQYKLAPVFFLSPALILFSIYVVYPILSSLWISLYEWDGLGEKTWVGIRNYIEMWEDDRIHTAIYNNIIWLICFLFAPPISLALGIFLNQH